MKNIISKTMKTSGIFSLIAVLFLGALTSCVQDDDYSVPSLEVVEPNLTANTTISLVKAMEAGSLVVFPSTTEADLILEGYVISNDEAGNFYKVLILQDSPDNPTAGIQIDIDDPALNSLYKPGRKVYVKLNGLGMIKLNGVLHIGRITGSSVGRISATNYQDYIFRSTTIADLTPKLITPAQYNDSYINTLVQIDNMQLNSSEVGQAYANANNTFTVNRNIKNCVDGSLTLLRNSGFADFKNYAFPTGQGSLVAVFSKYNSDYQLFIRDTTDVMFDGERCDNTGGGTPGGATLPFAEDFTAQTAGTGATVSIDGWINTNVNGGDRLFEVREFSNNKYAQTSAYNSDEDPFEVWLVTPGLDLSGTTAPILNFGTNDGYNNGVALKAFISTDFTGDPTTATWTELTGAIISTGHTSSYGTGFVSSGDLSLASYIGSTVYVGFQYLGSSSGITTTYQIDNISVTDN